MEREGCPVSAREELSARARRHLEEGVAVRQEVARCCLDSIVAAAELLADRFRAGGRLYLCGNGGSAADCQHLAAEFVSRLSAGFQRPPLPAVALTTDSSFLTAYANDVGFEGVFERQVEALGRPGDVLLGISTSGSSANVVRALGAARRLGLATIALTGEGGQLTGLADVIVAVPGGNTQHVQEGHLAIEHILCDLVEQALFGPSGQPGR